MKTKPKIAFGRLDLLRNDTLNNKNKIRIGFFVTRNEHKIQ